MTPRFYVRKQIVMVYEVTPRDDSSGDGGTRTATILTTEDSIQPHQVDGIVKGMWREENAKAGNRI